MGIDVTVRIPSVVTVVPYFGTSTEWNTVDEDGNLTFNQELVVENGQTH